jgi:hypothetical protein
MSWLEEDENELSYLKLGITLTIAIFVGVLGANVISTEISKGILARELVDFANEASEQLRISTEKIKLQNIKREALRVQQTIEKNEIRQRQSIVQAQQNRIIRIKQERNTSANRKRIETCNFWQEQYRKTKRADDRVHRDNSCKAANNIN